MAKNAKKKVPIIWSVVVPVIAVAVLVPLGIIVARQASLNSIDNFEACKEAKGEVIESYPEQCHINGKTFVNEAQKPGGAYIGLTEKAAMDKAGQDGVTARVVEREGEGVPVTMDLADGRHNFYIKNGTVYKVEVESIELQ